MSKHVNERIAELKAKRDKLANGSTRFNKRPRVKIANATRDAKSSSVVPSSPKWKKPEFANLVRTVLAASSVARK